MCIRDSYYDWTPTETGTDYRVMGIVKESGSSSSTAVIRYSEYYVIDEAEELLTITSVTPDIDSPQNIGTEIRWTCNITGGNNPVYYFYVYKGSTIEEQSTSYSSNNYYDFTPTETGTDYRVMGVVKESGSASSTAICKYSEYYTIDEAEAGLLAIESVTPDLRSLPFEEIDVLAQKAVGQVKIISFVTSNDISEQYETTLTMEVEASGGSDLLYQFQVYDEEEWVYSTEYTTDSTCKWTTNKAGEYTLYVYVKDSESNEDYDAYEKLSYIVVEVVQPAEEEITPVSEEDQISEEGQPEEEVDQQLIDETQQESDEVTPEDEEEQQDTDETRGRQKMVNYL
jgi:hypothetical protein